MNEIWKPVLSYPLYEASSLGQIRNKKTLRIRKLKRCSRGYLWAPVYNGRGGSKNASVARMVCEAFNGPAATGQEVDHVNRERDANIPENLRWVSKGDNLANRECAAGENHHAAKLTPAAVKTIRSSTDTVTALARAFGVSRATIRTARDNKLWRSVQ